MFLKVLDIYRRQWAILRCIVLPVEGWLTLLCGLVVHSIDTAHCLHRRILVEGVNRGHDEMRTATRSRVEQGFAAVKGDRVECKDGGR